MVDLTINRAIFTTQRCTVYRCQGHGTTRTAAHSLSLYRRRRRRRPSSSSRSPFRSSAANISFFEFKEA